MIKYFILFFSCLLSVQAHIFPSSLDMKLHDEKIDLQLVIPSTELYLWMDDDEFPDDKQGQKRVLQTFSKKYFQVLAGEQRLQAEFKSHRLEKRELEYLRKGKTEIEVHDFHHFHFSYKLETAIEELSMIPPHSSQSANDFDEEFPSVANIQMQFSLVAKGFSKSFYMTRKTYFKINKAEPFNSELYHLTDGEREIPGTDSRWLATLNGFLSISSYEFRQDLLFPLDYFADQLGISYEGEKVSEELKKTLLEKAESFIKENFKVKINAVEQEFKDLTVHLTMDDMNQLVHKNEEQKEFIFLNSLLAVSVSLKSKGKINSVEWLVAEKSLNKFLKRYNLFIRYPDKKKENLELTGSNNSFQWQRASGTIEKGFTIETPRVLFLRLPLWTLLFIPLNMFFFAYYLLKKKPLFLLGAVLSALCAIASVFIDLYVIPNPFQPKVELSDEQASKVTEQLLQRTYACFERRDESDLYDALEMSVQGVSLKEIYLSIQEKLRTAQAGGPQVEVDRVKLLDGEILEQAYNTEKFRYDFKLKAKWQVDGSLIHWGHEHKRKQVYEAVIVVTAKEKSSWKILSYELEGMTQL